MHTFNDIYIKFIYFLRETAHRHEWRWFRGRGRRRGSQADSLLSMNLDARLYLREIKWPKFSISVHVFGNDDMLSYLSLHIQVLPTWDSAEIPRIRCSIVDLYKIHANSFLTFSNNPSQLPQCTVGTPPHNVTSFPK